MGRKPPPPPKPKKPPRGNTTCWPCMLGVHGVCTGGTCICARNGH